MAQAKLNVPEKSGGAIKEKDKDIEEKEGEFLSHQLSYSWNIHVEYDTGYIIIALEFPLYLFQSNKNNYNQRIMIFFINLYLIIFMDPIFLDKSL